MNTIKVRNLEIGTGMPKICVPIVGKTVPEILENAKSAVQAKADVVEWRVDWYEDVFSFECVGGKVGKYLFEQLEEFNHRRNRKRLNR